MPDWKPEVRKRLRGAQLEPTREAEIVDELADHLEDRYAELLARGAAEEDARRSVLDELDQGDVLAAELRRSEPGPGPEPVPAGAAPGGSLGADLLRDLRYAARALRKSPGFALAVTLTLGLGIGANSAAFTVVNTLLLNPLPVVDASALVALHTVDTGKAEGSEALWPLSFPNLEDLQERNRVFTHLAAYAPVTALTWMNGRTPERIFAEVVTANYTALGEAPQPCVYLPLRQNFADAVVLYVRTRSDPADVLASVQGEIRSLDPLLWVSDVRTMGKAVDQALFWARIGVGLLGVFGLLALGLASIGLYGVMAYSVNLRRREIGVRMALGAGEGSMVALVMWQGIALVGAGLGLGLLGSLLLGRALSGLLYGLSPADPVSLGGAAAVLLAVGALACYLPAREASRVDPLVALREA
jgi:hypothetical protein